MKNKIKILHTKESCSAYGADEQIRVLCDFLKDEYDIYRASPDGMCISNSKGIYKRFFNVGFKSSFDWKSIKQLASIMKSEDFDIVHSHSSRSDWITFAGWLLSRNYRTKLITTIHAENDIFIEKNINSFKTKMVLKLRPLILKIFFKKITTVSDAIRNIMVDKMAFSSKQVIHTINGNDLKRIDGIDTNFNLREELNIKSKYIVITSGRVRIPLGESKGYLDYIEAIKILNKKRDDIFFLALGGGEDFDNLKKYTDSLNLENFKLLGHKDNPLDYINKSDIFLLLSHKNVEGMPRALMEAMGLGMPCIGTNVGGPSEIIADGTNGFLVEEKSPLQIVDKIEKLLEDIEKRESFSKISRELIHTKYSNENMADVYKKVYIEVMK